MSSAAGFAVRRVTPDDVDVYRDIRLRALQEAPSAFASTLDAEATRSRQEWVDRVLMSAAGVERATFLAFDEDRCVGLVSCGPDDLGADRQLVSMWVAPTHRGSGVAMGLIAAVLAWAKEIGAAEIALWVARDNDRARRLYGRAGFVVTGDVQPLPSDPSREEIRMARTV
jgi:GNAT superfamily N-acetyltransferase